MKTIIFGLSLIMLLFTVDLVYAEKDILQEWKNYIESYKDYIEKYKTWAQNKFQVYEDNINELERKIFELKREIKHLEEENNIFETENIAQPQQETKQLNVELPYVTTDKQNYSLGDTVYVTGKLMSAFTKQLLNGTLVYPSHENINISIMTPENTKKSIDRLAGCYGYYPYDETQYPVEINNWGGYETPIEFGKYYHHTSDKRTECNIHDGVFEGSFVITGDFTAGIHKISYLHQSTPMGANTDRHIHSQPFTVR